MNEQPNWLSGDEIITMTPKTPNDMIVANFAVQLLRPCSNTQWINEEINKARFERLVCHALAGMDHAEVESSKAAYLAVDVAKEILLTLDNTNTP